MDLMWQAKELSESGIRHSLKLDRQAEDAIREGSRNLLKQLWVAHPNRMRQLYHAGKAEIPFNAVTVPKLKREKPKVQPVPTIGIELAREVASDFGITRATLMAPSRKQELVAARAIVAKILDKRGWSLPRIARAIGRSDHSTIANLLQNADYLIKKIPGAIASYDRNLAKFLPEAVKRG